MENEKHPVHYDYEINRTNSNYSTVWISFYIGDKKIRKKFRVYHKYLNGIWCPERCVWVSIRYALNNLVGKEMTVTEFNRLLRCEKISYDDEYLTLVIKNMVWMFEYGSKIDEDIYHYDMPYKLISAAYKNKDYGMVEQYIDSKSGEMKW